MELKELLVIREKALKNLKIAKDNSNIKRIENYEDQINRIDNEISKLEPKKEDNLDRVYNNLVNIYVEDYKRLLVKFNEEKANGSKLSELRKKFGNKTFELFYSNLYHQFKHDSDFKVNNIIEQSIRDAKSFVKNMESKLSKYGKIIDVKNLKCNMCGIEGTIQCENKTVEVTSVLAGGYNIQRLHVRLLIK